MSTQLPVLSLRLLLIWIVSIITACGGNRDVDPSGTRYFSEALTNPPRLVHVIEVPLAGFPDRYRLITRTGPSGLVAGATVSEVLSGSFTEDEPQPIAMINGTLRQDDLQWSGSLRGPYLRDGSLLQTTDNTHQRAFGPTEGFKLWLAILNTGVELKLENGFATEVKLNNNRRAQDIVLYTRGAFEAVSGRPGPGPYLLPGTPVKSYVLAPLDGKGPLLPVPGSPDGTGGAQRFYVKRSTLGSTTLELDELAITVGANAPQEVVSQLNTLNIGKLVTLRAWSTVSTQYGKCSPPLGSLNGPPKSFISSGGEVMLAYSESEGVYVPDEVKKQKKKWVRRAPRSALCWNDDKLFMVAVDGFRLGPVSLLRTMAGLDTSIGMTVAELSEYMKAKLGCRCAIALDGGKCSSLYFDGAVVNHPARGVEFPSNGYIALIPSK